MICGMLKLYPVVPIYLIRWAIRLLEKLKNVKVDRFLFLPAANLNYVKLNDLDIQQLRRAMQISVYGFCNCVKV